MIVQVAGPALLYLPGTQSFRILFRISVFGFGMIGLLALRRRSRAVTHPSVSSLILATAYMALMVLHPSTNTILAGLAQTFMQLAVFAPVLWAPSYFLGDTRRLTRVLAILWLFNMASATVGILQVRDPQRWLPAEFSSGVTGGKFGLAVSQYRTDDGRMVVRPPGLGDNPGAACWCGIFVASMGLGCLALPMNWACKLMGLLGGMAGVTVIFLTQVRSSFVVLVGAQVVFLAILFAQKRVGLALVLAGAMVAGGIGSLGYAASIGGRSVVDRFATLIGSDPIRVYDSSARLGMVTGTFDSLLMDYPLGAGLGRWGMMRDYFGNEGNLHSPPIWAEVQFAAWALDGGVVLLALYCLALVIASRRLIHLCLRHPSLAMRQWAAVVFMLCLPSLALMFSFVPFNSQLGMQFWFLVGAIEGVAQGVESPGEATPLRAQK